MLTKWQSGNPDQSCDVWVRWEKGGKTAVSLGHWDGEDFCMMQPSFEYGSDDYYTFESNGMTITGWQPLNPPGA